MKLLLSILFVMSGSVMLSAMDEGERLANEKCGRCHLMGEITKEKLDKMKAPPYWAIAKKARERYENEEDKVKYIIDYALDPSEDKMLFPKETKEMFGVMPSLKDKVSKEEIEIISEYILRKRF